MRLTDGLSLVYRLLWHLVLSPFGKNRRKYLKRIIGVSHYQNFVMMLARHLSPVLLTFIPSESAVQSVAKKIKGNLFVDVGANIGLYTLLLAPQFEKVIAVEPFRKSLEAIRLSADAFHFNNITFMNAAISDCNSYRQFYLADDDDSHHSLVGRSKNQTYQVTPTFSLDYLLRDYSGTILVKVDIEGSEWELLRGAKKSLSKRRVRHWIIEMHDPTRKSELESLFRSYQYKARWMDAIHIYAWY